MEKVLVAAGEVGTLNAFAFPFSWSRPIAFVTETWRTHPNSCHNINNFSLDDN